jgi:hypothetical protein
MNKKELLELEFWSSQKFTPKPGYYQLSDGLSTAAQLAQPNIEFVFLGTWEPPNFYIVRIPYNETESTSD